MYTVFQIGSLKNDKTTILRMAKWLMIKYTSMNQMLLTI